MTTFKNAVSLIVAVSLMGLILIEQHAYQQSWSGSSTAPAASEDTSSAAASFAPGVETIVMK
jgi:hypothetical protein